MLRVALIVAALAVFVSACGSAEIAPTTRGATIPPSTNPAGGPLAFSIESTGGSRVVVTLTNTGDAALTVVRPFITPNFVRFDVAGPDGAAVPFDGPYFRLAPLADEAFADLAPGASVSHTFDLAETFALPGGPLTVTAEYRNRPNGTHEGDRALTTPRGDEVGADPIEVTP
mgnify:CR=1 FL=1